MPCLRLDLTVRQQRLSVKSLRVVGTGWFVQALGGHDLSELQADVGAEGKLQGFFQMSLRILKELSKYNSNSL